MNEDQDLKKLRKNLTEAPSSLDVQKWKSALRTKKNKKTTPLWVHWIAASFLGFSIGATAFYKKDEFEITHKVAMEKSYESATIEVIESKWE